MQFNFHGNQTRFHKSGFHLGYINDFHKCSKQLHFHLFADDANLFLKHKNVNILESNLNNELSKV